MAEVKLSGGKTVKIDVTGLTVKAYREFTSSNGAVEAENEIIKQCTGIEIAELETMTYTDSRVIIKAILRAANQPMLDPS